MMKQVTVYSKEVCPYCDRAKQLLKNKDVDYEEIRVDEDEQQLAKMKELSGQRTVPQIFIGDEPIGGFDELYALVKEGQFESKLEQ